MNVGTLKLDIRICECSSCDNLVLEDHSFYLTDQPERPKVQIAIPGYTSGILFDFIPSKSNIFNSYSFGLSNNDCLQELSDGLYTITYMICPYDELFQTIYHIRQCKSWCRWDKLLIKFFDSCLDLPSDSEKMLNKIEYLLKGAEAFAKDCEPDKAIELHQKAVELLTRLECVTK